MTHDQQPITILRKLFLFMKEHVHREAPLEACGLVGGRNGMAELIFPIVNLLQSSTRYKMEPQEQINALLKMESQGMELLAIYHSHPKGPAYPSQTDIAEAYYPDSAYLIWSLIENDWDCRAYCLKSGNVKEISINIKK